MADDYECINIERETGWLRQDSDPARLFR